MVIVEGKIKGKDRPRFFRGHAVTSKATREYEKFVKDKLYYARWEVIRNASKG